MNDRQIRGMAIISKGTLPQSESKEVFLIPSQSNEKKKYKVSHRQKWECTCPDFKNGNICKHIFATQFWLKMRAKTDSDSSFSLEKVVLENDKCPYCKTDKVAKNGCRTTKTGKKQRFLCLSCKRTFIAEKDFGKLKGNVKIAMLVIDLYMKGFSLRKIQDHLLQFYGLEIHHETARRWILRFTKRMNDYVSQFKPETGKTWHADEQAVKARTDSKKGGCGYIWNVLDADTRFLIASKMTRIRSRDEADDIFMEAKKNTDKPEKIITDKFIAYGHGIHSAYGNEVEHQRYKGFVANVQNNKIERFHGTFRERDKTMRGFKSVETAGKYNDTFRLYYNFVRTHTTLGMTPSEKAKIILDLGRNKWMGLLKLSMDNNQGNQPKSDLCAVSECSTE